MGMNGGVGMGKLLEERVYFGDFVYHIHGAHTTFFLQLYLNP